MKVIIGIYIIWGFITLIYYKLMKKSLIKYYNLTRGKKNE